jgi:hypothetical protein
MHKDYDIIYNSHKISVSTATPKSTSTLRQCILNSYFIKRENDTLGVIFAFKVLQCGVVRQMFFVALISL